MKKVQIILIGSGIIVVFLLFQFGKTVPEKQPHTHTAMAEAGPEAGTSSPDSISAATILAASMQQLTPSQQTYVNKLVNSVVRGDVKQQQIRVYQDLADFYRDSAHLLLPFGYYTGEVAKLENSEKKLTFAGHFFLDGFQQQDNPSLRRWMALQAKELFEKALVLNPDNDSLKVAIGTCYLFGGINAAPMQGIAMIKEVTDHNPHDVYAQKTLAMGGMMSGQFDKAIERLELIAADHPDDAEIILMLADANERAGNSKEAIKWYEKGKKLVANPDAVAAINERIKALKQP